MVARSNPPGGDVVSTPRVTICVPTIGRVRYLPETLASVRGQTYRDYEVIILENGSPPESRELLREYVASDPRVRILSSETRIPMFVNFNRGLAAARGEYIAYCHDDDVYYPEFLERHVDMLEKNPSVAFVGSNFNTVDEESRIIAPRELVRLTEVVPGRRFIIELLTRGRGVFSTPGLVYRTNALALDGFVESVPVLWGDYILLMVIAETWDVGAIAEVLWGNRRHVAQTSRAMPFSQSIAIRDSLFRDYAHEYLKRWPTETTFARTLASRAKWSHLTGALWAWFVAPDDNEAESSLSMLFDGARSPLERPLHRISRLVRSLGIVEVATPPLRRLGRALRI